MTIESRNLNHPELREGEIWLTNDGKWGLHEEVFDEIRWTTKRKGKVAYDRDGKVIPKLFPVFVQRAELVREGILME